MKFSRSFFPALLMFSVFSIPVLAAPPEGKGKPPKPPDGGGDPTECSYPSFSDIPKDKLSGDAANFAINYGDDVGEFVLSMPSFIEDGSGVGSDSGRLLVEDMTDVQHRAGNRGIDAWGAPCGEHCSPEGKRNSAWYYDDELFGFHDDNLWLGGKRVKGAEVTDPTRPPSGDPDANPWYYNRLYTTWLSTWQRTVDEDGNVKVDEDGNVIPKDGSQAFKPPMYLKTEVSFEKMQTPGFRLSMWLMPVELSGEEFLTPSIAYDGDPSNGFEMDIFEFEPVSVIRNAENPFLDEVCGNIIEFAWINSFATKGKSAKNASGKNHFEGLEEGYCSDEPTCDDTYDDPNGPQPAINVGRHTIEFLWMEDHIVWAFNNEIVLEITDPTKIPDSDREHYLIVSREMTNGLTSGTEIYDGGDTFLPPEGGLYGWNGNSNIGDYFDKINADRAWIDYIKIYELP